MADVFMISSLGEEAITAVSVAGQVFFLFSFFGINSGASAFMGQFYGKGDNVNIRKTMGICIAISFSAAALFVGLSLIIPERLLTIYSKDPKVIRIGSEYLRIVCVSFFFMALSTPINNAYKLRKESTNRTRIGMKF
jgi:Na+-driven multidrug efflux pump